MKTAIVMAGVLLLWTLGPARAQQCSDICANGTCSNNAAVTCTTNAQCVWAAVGATCPCDGSSNHGQHQSCVVHLRNQLRKQGCSTAAVASCAARSTCGKPNRVLCCRVASTGTCTIPDGSSSGTCSTNGAVCASDADCTVVSGPRITRDAAACTARGGYSSGTGSVCDGCQPPVACCVPSSTVGQPGACAVLSATDCAAANGTPIPGAAPTCTGVICPVPVP